MFFAKLAASIALVAPFVSALTIDTPTNWTSGDPAVITWSAVNGDPQTFSVELVNDAFNRQFALANNIATGSLTLSLTLPVVPVGDGYNLQFVNIGNISDVFASTGGFSIGATLSTSTTSTSSSSASGSASASASLTTASGSASGSSSGFGTTRSGSTAGSSTGTGSASASAGSSTSFDNAAIAIGVSHFNLAGFAVTVFAALAGARLVGF